VKSAPDGYTLMIISSTPLVTLPHLQKVPYDVLKNLVGVTQTTLLAYAFVVNPATGIGSIQELIARAKKEPGRLKLRERRKRLRSSTSTWSSSSTRRTSTSPMFRTRARHRRSRRCSQASRALMLDVTVAVMPHVKAGKLRALMVTGSAPLEQLPVRFLSIRSFRDWHPGLARHLRDRRNAKADSRQARRGRPRGARAPRRDEPFPRARRRTLRGFGGGVQRDRAARLRRAGARSSAQTRCARTDPRRYHVRGSARAIGDAVAL